MRQLAVLVPRRLDPGSGDPPGERRVVGLPHRRVRVPGSEPCPFSCGFTTGRSNTWRPSRSADPPKKAAEKGCRLPRQPFLRLFPPGPSKGDPHGEEAALPQTAFGGGGAPVGLGDPLDHGEPQAAAVPLREGLPGRTCPQILGRSSGAMPVPSSRTVSTAQPADSSRPITDVSPFPAIGHGVFAAGCPTAAKGGSGRR